MALKEVVRASREKGREGKTVRWMRVRETLRWGCKGLIKGVVVLKNSDRFSFLSYQGAKMRRQLRKERNE